LTSGVAERSDPFEEPGDLGQVADVRRIGAQAPGVRSGPGQPGPGWFGPGQLGPGQLGAGRVEALLRPARYHHCGSVGQAAPGHGQPDARAAADDDDRGVRVH